MANLHARGDASRSAPGADVHTPAALTARLAVNEEAPAIADIDTRSLAVFSRTLDTQQGHTLAWNTCAELGQALQVSRELGRCCRTRELNHVHVGSQGLRADRLRTSSPPPSPPPTAGRRIPPAAAPRPACRSALPLFLHSKPLAMAEAGADEVAALVDTILEEGQPHFGQHLKMPEAVANKAIKTAASKLVRALLHSLR